jgi:hypothetical protein
VDALPREVIEKENLDPVKQKDQKKEQGSENKKQDDKKK